MEAAPIPAKWQARAQASRLATAIGGMYVRLPQMARSGTIAWMTKRGKLLALLHPILFALLPIISLLSHNINEAPIFHALRPALMAVLLALALFFVLNAIVKDWPETGLLTSLFLILFFSYGHVLFGLVHESAQSLFAGIGIVGRHDALSIAWLGLAAIGGFAIHRLHRLRASLTQLFLIMALAAVSAPVLTITSHEIQISKPLRPNLLEIPTDQLDIEAEKPDIYYIVLDGYARSDILRNLFGYDNSDFIAFLQANGFQVAYQSRSNYTQTGLSMASSLNMSYLDTLAQALGADSDDRTPLMQLIRWSEVRRLLEKMGYSIVGFDSGYRVTELENADIYLRAPLDGPTTLERLAFETSGLIFAHDVGVKLGLQPFFPGYDAHRNRIAFTLDQLRKVPSLPGPKFVLAHVLVPHPPFVFGSNGEEMEQHYPFTLMDGDAFLGSTEEYIQGYRGQVTFINGMMEGIVLKILSASPEPPIILIQADHGPGSRLNWTSAESTDLEERTAILSAYHLPGAPEDIIYQTISPVNSFRVVFNHYFGSDLNLLPDKSYYSTFDQPYMFVSID